MYRLTAVSGPTRGKHYSLDEGQITIGRQSTNQIALPSGKVSKLHCVIEVYRESVIVLDQNSSNGTFVNGLLAKKKKLNVGDRISIGEYIFELNIKPVKQPQLPAEIHAGLPMDLLAGGMGGGIDLGVPGSGGGGHANELLLLQGPPDDLKGKFVWVFEKKFMPILYELNTKHEWRILCMGLFVLFLFLNLFVSVYPILQADQGTLIKEVERRALFLAEQIVDQNNSFIAAGAETKTTIGIVEKATGVKTAFLLDLDLRIIAPGSRLNQYLSGGPEGLFAIKMRDLYRKGKDDFAYRFDEDSGLVMAIVPVQILSAVQGKNVVTAMALVAIDSQASNPDSGEIGLVYSKTFILTGILAIFIFALFYKLTLNPFEVLNDDLDKALKGNLSEVTRVFQFSELNSLYDLINSAIQRASSSGGSGGGGGDDPLGGNAADDFVYPLQMISQLVKFGLVVFDSEKRLLHLNSIFEELSGIRSDSAIGQNMASVARDQALVSFVEDLLDRAHTGSEGLSEDFDFSGVSFKMYGAAFGSVSGRPKGYVLCSLKVDE